MDESSLSGIRELARELLARLADKATPEARAMADKVAVAVDEAEGAWRRLAEFERPNRILEHVQAAFELSHAEAVGFLAANERPALPAAAPLRSMTAAVRSVDGYPSTLLAETLGRLDDVARVLVERLTKARDGNREHVRRLEERLREASDEASSALSEALRSAAKLADLELPAAEAEEPAPKRRGRPPRSAK